MANYLGDQVFILRNKVALRGYLLSLFLEGHFRCFKTFILDFVKGYLKDFEKV